MARDGLGNHTSEPRQIDDVLHLLRVAERAGGDEDRVGEVEASEGDSKINHDGPPDGCYNVRMSRKPSRPMTPKLPRRYRGANVPMRVIRRFVRQIAERFQPDKIILFGS